MVRLLPSSAAAADILARKRTRPARRPPPQAGRALGKFLKALEGRFGDVGPAAGTLARQWREIAGEVLARRTEPVKLVRPRRGGGACLEIRVDGPAAALVQHQAPDILARVNLVLGAGAVEKLRIVQGPVKPRALSQAPPSLARRRAPPLDAAAEAQLAATMASAPDSALKAALIRLGREIARRG